MSLGGGHLDPRVDRSEGLEPCLYLTHLLNLHAGVMRTPHPRLCSRWIGAVICTPVVALVGGPLWTTCAA
jgi:hypothetical protein